MEGKGGKDILTGLSGKDRFVYRSIRDSGLGSRGRDIITDFHAAIGEIIDLSVIDAYSKIKGNQSFSYIGSGSFSGRRGEVRFASGLLQINTGTDKRPDMEIQLSGVSSFDDSFLIL